MKLIEKSTKIRCKYQKYLLKSIKITCKYKKISIKINKNLTKINELRMKIIEFQRKYMNASLFLIYVFIFMCIIGL